MELRDIRTLLTDGDGVLWRASEPVPGLQRFFDVLAGRKIAWALLTNNATRSQAEHLARLHDFGIQAAIDQVYSSSSVAVEMLLRRHGPGAVVFVVGEDSLVDAINAAGLKASNRPPGPVRADAVVSAMDRQMTYDRVAAASRLVRAGAAFYATNPDKTFPTPDGLIPGAGAVTAAVAAAAGVEPVVIGKPETTLFEAAMRGLHASPSSTAMLGDRLETDILGGIRAGIATIAVLSGVSTCEQIKASPYQPDFIFENIAELADALDQA
jgi:4-nitrophenyl phosphatase